MADVLTPSQRSYCMSQIQGKDTRPELAVRSLLHRMGYRFRLHRKDLPGKPDIVLPRFRSVVFVHGCYWHRHKGCKYAYVPKTRRSFWKSKFKENVNRDSRTRKQLHGLGWKVLVLWECEIRDIANLQEHLDSFLSKKEIKDETVHTNSSSKK